MKKSTYECIFEDFQPITPAGVITREDHADELAKKHGISPESHLMGELLKLHAKARHESRKAGARAAAEFCAGYVFEHELSSNASSKRLSAMLILLADIVGIGGYAGIEGAATVRHPAFGRCGKGRKQASDGAAWSAAIEAQFTEMQVDRKATIKFVKDGIMLEHDGFESLPSKNLMAPAWERSLVLNFLAPVSPAMRWIRRLVPIDDESNLDECWLAIEAREDRECAYNAWVRAGFKEFQQTVDLSGVGNIADVLAMNNYGFDKWFQETLNEVGGREELLRYWPEEWEIDARDMIAVGESGALRLNNGRFVLAFMTFAAHAIAEQAKDAEPLVVGEG